MSSKAFDKMMRGLEEAKAYMEGERKDYKVTVPPTVDVKSIRKGLNMTQAAFSDNFGFSLDAVKHWEGGRRTPEVPARAYLTVIQRNPSLVLEALRPTPQNIDPIAVRRKA
jgi:putative transcriptional regulator